MPWPDPFRKRPTESPWWRHFPRTESRTSRPMPDGAQPVLAVDSFITLNGKPERVRRVLAAKWHAHRYEFVYIVETSAPDHFQPYWFFGQLTIVDPDGDR